MPEIVDRLVIGRSFQNRGYGSHQQAVPATASRFVKVSGDGPELDPVINRHVHRFKGEDR